MDAPLVQDFASRAAASGQRVRPVSGPPRTSGSIAGTSVDRWHFHSIVQSPAAGAGVWTDSEGRVGQGLAGGQGRRFRADLCGRRPAANAATCCQSKLREKPLDMPTDSLPTQLLPTHALERSLLCSESRGQLVQGDRFFDRCVELGALSERVRDGTHTLLTAQRRVGKTGRHPAHLAPLRDWRSVVGRG